MELKCEVKKKNTFFDIKLNIPHPLDKLYFTVRYCISITVYKSFITLLWW